MARWLSLHVVYACQHAGACCSSGWPIPIERVRVPAIASAIAAGTIDVQYPWLLPVLNQPPEVAGVLAASQGRCVFRQSSGQETRCAIHSAIDHQATPLACQHFPRVCLIDDRGVSVTLSHYCPTAASLLESHAGPVTIVEGPEPVANGEPEGLDARGAWPPLLARNVLMDLAAYSQWEAHLVAWLGGARNPDGQWAPESVLHMLHEQAGRLASWRPGDQTLSAAIQGLAVETPASPTPTPDWTDEQRIRTAAVATLPPSQEWDPAVIDMERWWTRDVADAWRANARILNRFLCAHAFAAWSAYQADGVVANVRQLRLALAVLREEAARITRREGGPLTRARLLSAIRQTDLLLVHLVDRSLLAAELEVAGDREPPRRHI